MLAISLAVVLISEALVLAVFIADILLATVVISVAFGTNLWKVYVCNVVVVSTKNPKSWGIALVTPVIVTVLPVPAPLVIVTVVPLGVKVVDAVLTETIVPVPLFISGFAVGKLVSFAIGTKPPTSSTRSIILSLIAAVVAIVVSLSGNTSPSLIVSPVDMLKYLASAAASVRYKLLRAPPSSSVSV